MLVILLPKTSILKINRTKKIFKRIQFHEKELPT